MAIYSYLSTVTPDYTTTTLSVAPHAQMVFSVSKNQSVALFDDGTEDRISFDDTPVFFVELQWNLLSSTDQETILDFYVNSSKGNGIARSFKWAHPTDTYTYVVRFTNEFNYSQYPVNFGIQPIVLKILGRIAA